MIVNRRMFTAKKGRMDEGVAFAKKMFAELAPNVRLRVYKASIARFDTFGWEAEYESLAAYEQSVAEMRTRVPREWHEQWGALTETGGTNEIWNLV